MYVRCVAITSTVQAGRYTLPSIRQVNQYSWGLVSVHGKLRLPVTCPLYETARKLFIKQSETNVYGHVVREKISSLDGCEIINNNIRQNSSKTPTATARNVT